MQRCPYRRKEAQNRDNDNKKYIQPIEMPVPILPSDRQLTDMRRLARHFSMLFCREWLIWKKLASVWNIKVFPARWEVTTKLSVPSRSET